MNREVIKTYTLVFLLAACVVSQEITVSCPKSWQLYAQRNKCIMAFDTQMSWADARSYCRQEGGDLVAIFDQATNDFVKGLFDVNTPSYWIGLHSRGRGNKFGWTDGSTLTDYEDWYQARPEEKSGEMCVEASVSSNFQWSQAGCTERKGFVCEHQTLITTKTPICPIGWTAHDAGNECVLYHGGQWEYYYAKPFCSKKGGFPVIIQNEAKQEFLKKCNAYGVLVRGSYTNWERRPSGYSTCTMIRKDEDYRWLSDSCSSSTAATICQRDPIGEVSNDYTCPSEWKFLSSAQACVRRFDEKMAWSDARASCQKMGADLVLIQDSTASHFISNEINGSMSDFYWIGLKKTNNLNRFVWVDNTSLAGFTNWQLGQPNSYDEEDCVQIFTGESGSWHDDTCSDKIGFICEMPATVTAATCPDRWELYNEGKVCTQVVKKRKTWANARTSCNQEGGDLLSIPNNSTYEFILKELMKNDHKYWWIGLTHSNQNGQFRWVDNKTQVDFVDWGQGQEVNIEGRNCVQISTYKNFTWYQANCLRRFDFVCERQVEFINIKCPSGWRFHKQNSICVRLFHDKKTWNDSKAFCEERGGELATVENGLKNDFLIQVASTTGHGDEFWIGLCYEGSRYRWVDNTTLTFTYWKRRFGHQNIQDGSCARMDKNVYYQWVTEQPNDLKVYEFICQRKASFVKTTTKIPMPTTTPALNVTTLMNVTTIGSGTDMPTVPSTLGIHTISHTIADDVTSMPMSDVTDENNDLSGGSKAGIAIGCIAVVAMVTLVSGILLRRARKGPWSNSSNGNSRIRSVLFRRRRKYSFHNELSGHSNPIFFERT